MTMRFGRAIREQFPAFKAAKAPFHYLDSGATAQICAQAANALMGFELNPRANVKRGVYKLADAATVAFDEARETMAAYIGADRPEEVIFTSGATMSLNIAAGSLVSTLSPGDEILLSALEHHSNIVPWQLAAERHGVLIKAIPVTIEGRLDLEKLGELVGERTRIVAVTHVSNVTGSVTDLGRIRKAAPHALLVVDGAQRAPHGPIDVQALDCDFYALSSHKMFGPTGAGVLWGRHQLLSEMPPFMGGGEMIRQVSFNATTFAPPPHRFEAGTPSIGPVLGMAAAAKWLSDLDWQMAARHELAMVERLLAGLSNLDGVRIAGPDSLQERFGIVAFEVEGVHAHDLCQMLDGFGLSLRGGHHCAQPLMDALDLAATVRVSLAPYNDFDDIDALLESLPKVIARLR